MKNKASTYLLILCIIAVWGFVGHRLFNAFNNNKSVTNIKPQKSQVSSNQTQLDFQLALNYPDPFLIKNAPKTDNEIVLTNKISSTINNNGISLRQLQNKELAPNKLEVRYKGSINNLSKKGQVAIVEINGIQQLISVGDTLTGKQVIKITPDSICLAIARNKIWISRF